MAWRRGLRICEGEVREEFIHVILFGSVSWFRFLIFLICFGRMSILSLRPLVPSPFRSTSNLELRPRLTLTARQPPPATHPHPHRLPTHLSATRHTPATDILFINSYYRHITHCHTSHSKKQVTSWLDIIHSISLFLSFHLFHFFHSFSLSLCMYFRLPNSEQNRTEQNESKTTTDRMEMSVWVKDCNVRCIL